MDNGAVSDRASDTAEYSGRYPLYLGFLRASLSARSMPKWRQGGELVFAGCAENSYARPRLLRSRLVRLVLIGHGALLRGEFWQLPSPISISSRHQKLALPVEAVRARVDLAGHGSFLDFVSLILKIVERVVFRNPINNGRFFRMPVELRFGS